MSFSARQNFISRLDGVTVIDLVQKLDYSITSLEERKKLVEEILNSTNFFNEYFSGYFNPGITTKDSLSSEVNVCRALETFTNYILNSKEVKQAEDEEVQKYVFYTDPKKFEKKINREMSTESLTNNEENPSENLIYFLKSENKNHKKPKTQTINKKDLERDDFLGEVLRSYHAFSQFLVTELKKGKESKFNRYTLSKIKSQVDNDMIYSKDHLLGVWGYKLKSFYESTDLYFDVFDFTNVNHLHGVTLVDENGKREFIKGLLYFKPTSDYSDDFNLVLVDLENLINETETITEEELIILKAVQYGLPKKLIAELLGITAMKVTRSMISIAEKVAEKGVKYDGK